MKTQQPTSPGWHSPLFAGLPPGRCYLVAVSGGRDSVALLHWLLARGYQRLVVCHLNHRLRGRAAAADARFVQALARRLGVDCVIDSADVAKVAKARSLSVETAARALRYELFAAVARRYRCDTIFVGHNANDLVETFLMNLFRGASPSGLAALREISTHRIGAKKLTVVRPMLRVWRSEIDAFIAAAGLKFRDDATNAGVDPTRNRLRHRVLPFIAKELGRDVRKTIWRTAMIAADEETWLDSLPAPIDHTAANLNVKKLAALMPAQQRRTIHAWLKSHGVSDVNFDIVERVRALLDSSGGPAKTNMPKARYARRKAGEIFLE